MAKWLAGLALTFLALPAAASCVPSFPYRDGWLGGDLGLSIPLDADHSIWLFGDTFLVDATHGSRANSALVPNTVGISSCSGTQWSVHYYRRTDATSGSPRPIFDTGTDQSRYWPLDGFLKAQTLYIFLVQIAITGHRSFDFKEIGASLAEVTNPRAEPDRWKIRYRRLSPDPGLAVGVSAVVQLPYVYLYSVADHIAPGRHQVILARLPLDHLDSPAASVEYLTSRGRWKKGLDQNDARVLVDAGAPDFSVRFHRALSKWVMVQTDSDFPAREIGIRTADRLAGPWSAFRALYAIPEMRAASRPPDIFCYAAKEHLEFSSSPNSMSVSYACNLLSISRLANDTMLYRPIVISLRLNDAGNRGDNDGAPTEAPADQLRGGGKYLNGNEAERASRRF